MVDKFDVVKDLGSIMGSNTSWNVWGPRETFTAIATVFEKSFTFLEKSGGGIAPWPPSSEALSIIKVGQPV